MAEKDKTLQEIFRKRVERGRQGREGGDDAGRSIIRGSREDYTEFLLGS